MYRRPIGNLRRLTIHVEIEETTCRCQSTQQRQNDMGMSEATSTVIWLRVAGKMRGTLPRHHSCLNPWHIYVYSLLSPSYIPRIKTSHPHAGYPPSTTSNTTSITDEHRHASANDRHLRLITRARTNQQHITRIVASKKKSIGVAFQVSLQCVENG